jgi:holin-like protein
MKAAAGYPGFGLYGFGAACLSGVIARAIALMTMMEHEMVRAMAVLLLCQLAGTVVQQAVGLPVPGPVLGMVLLLGIFVWRGGPSRNLATTAQGLLKYLGLLFVPAGVGVVTQLQVLRANALAIAIAIPVSTVLGLAVTGVVMQFLLRGDAARQNTAVIARGADA